MNKNSGVQKMLFVGAACFYTTVVWSGELTQQQINSLPPPVRENYEVFLIRCGKCHPASRALNAQLTSDGWKSYIKKMIRRPGSGINQESAKQIYEFLRFHFHLGGNDDSQNATPSASDGGTPAQP